MTPPLSAHLARTAGRGRSARAHVWSGDRTRGSVWPDVPGRCWRPGARPGSHAPFAHRELSLSYTHGQNSARILPSGLALELELPKAAQLQLSRKLRETPVLTAPLRAQVSPGVTHLLCSTAKRQPRAHHVCNWENIWNRLEQEPEAEPAAGTNPSSDPQLGEAARRGARVTLSPWRCSFVRKFTSLNELTSQTPWPESILTPSFPGLLWKAGFSSSPADKHVELDLLRLTQ